MHPLHQLAEKRQRHGSYTGVSQASYRTNSLLIDADSEDEDVVNGGAVAHGSGHAYLGNHRVSKSPSNHFQTPSWTSSYQVKEVKERFKYTDTEGNDLWAYVKTVYNNDGRQVFILNEDGSGTEVSLNPLPGQCIYKREDYLDITKYWRDHHVPDYSIERSKPVVLRDAYVPEYSRLSARAQAWRGFTKPRASLASRVTFPISTHNQPLSSYKNQTGSSRKHHAGNGNGRSFHKYRNRRRRRQNYNKRTKINLATLVPHPVEQTEKHFRGKDAKKPDDHLHLENLHAVIVENLPDSLTNAYVKSLLQGYGEILAVRKLPVSTANGVVLVITPCADTAATMVNALHGVIFNGQTLHCSRFTKIPQDALQQIVKDAKEGGEENTVQEW